MYLTNKQLFLLTIPFLVALSLYFFYQDIASFSKYFFPSYDAYKNAILDKKADIYLKIESKTKDYDEIIKRIEERKKESLWIANLLHRQNEMKKAKEFLNKKNRRIEIVSYKLEAIFYDKKIAIINKKIIPLYGKVDGARLIKVEMDRVEIKTKKGTQWLYIFK